MTTEILAVTRKSSAMRLLFMHRLVCFAPKPAAIVTGNRRRRDNLIMCGYSAVSHLVLLRERHLVAIKTFIGIDRARAAVETLPAHRWAGSLSERL
ncbi:MAG: hypothetical protein JWM91_2273 [Rhodospirillales bacterium]|nr:hypothetical protein [Rhodospirillales bacterium]